MRPKPLSPSSDQKSLDGRDCCAARKNNNNNNNYNLVKTTYLIYYSMILESIIS
jgi:hypothetical protein